MPDKSNAEVAWLLADRIVPDGDIGNTRTPYVRAAAKEIEIALATAQSSLARQVLSEIGRLPAPEFTEMEIASISQRFREFFTRLGIRID